MPLGSGGTTASSAWTWSTRSAELADLLQPFRFFSGRFVVMSARDRSSTSFRQPPISLANRRTALSVHDASYWLARRWCRIRKRMLFFSASSFVKGGSAVDLVEHPRADLGVTEEVDLARRRDGARPRLADVVEQGRPADLEPRDGLTYHLLRVLPEHRPRRHSPSPKPTIASTSRTHRGEGARPRAGRRARPRRRRSSRSQVEAACGRPGG